MKKDYVGVVVEEGLEDKEILKGLDIVSFKISERLKWHMHRVRVSREDIEKISKVLKPEKWYMHFWHGRDVVAVFKDKIFEFNFDDKLSWQPVIEYGLSLGIPREQLDFPIE